MWFFRRKKKKAETVSESYSIIDVGLDEVKQAVRRFEQQLPSGITRAVLIKDDNRLDVELLKLHLGGIPSRTFYMSKETYEIFEDKDKMIPYYLDMVQKAVDDYIDAEKDFPISSVSAFAKINYDVLVEKYYLKEKPPIEMYLTKEENLITHKQPD